MLFFPQCTNMLICLFFNSNAVTITICNFKLHCLFLLLLSPSYPAFIRLCDFLIPLFSSSVRKLTLFMWLWRAQGCWLSGETTTETPGHALPSQHCLILLNWSSHFFFSKKSTQVKYVWMFWLQEITFLFTYFLKYWMLLMLKSSHVLSLKLVEWSGRLATTTAYSIFEI